MRETSFLFAFIKGYKLIQNEEMLKGIKKLKYYTKLDIIL